MKVRLPRLLRRLLSWAVNVKAGSADKIFQPLYLGRALLDAMKKQQRISLSTTYVPNHYTVFLHPNPAATISCMEQTLTAELKGVLLEKAEKECLSFIGPLEIHFEADDQLEPMDIQVDALFRENRPLEQAPPWQGATRVFRLISSAQARARLVVCGEDGAAAEYELGLEAVTIGRSRHCTVRLDDARASRCHAIIGLEKNEYVLRDENSTNGTFVNGSRIQQVALRQNDRIQIGSTFLDFLE